MTDTTDEHECDYPDTCQVCSPKLKSTPETVDYSFVAKYDGGCMKCQQTVYAGQIMVRMTTGRILCDWCSGVTDELKFL